MTPDWCHFDVSPIPNLLMEPSNTNDAYVDPVTLAVMYDIGWDGQLHCSLPSEKNAPEGMQAAIVTYLCSRRILAKITWF